MLKMDTYVVNIQGGGDSMESLRRFKEEATQIMAEAGFTLHKWHSNVRTLELDDVNEESKEMPVKANDSTRILGISYNKLADTLELDFTPCIKGYDILTKRKMTSTINTLYDRLGMVARITITGKLIFIGVCNKKFAWDEPVLPYLKKKMEGLDVYF